ncbi:hypothetical protein E4U28_004470 [Claviceps purpurea]|nr:hypothetical protein E4U28_004470 [Claviceps purpurea]
MATLSLPSATGPKVIVKDGCKDNTESKLSLEARTLSSIYSSVRSEVVIIDDNSKDRERVNKNMNLLKDALRLKASEFESRKFHDRCFYTTRPQSQHIYASGHALHVYHEPQTAEESEMPFIYTDHTLYKARIRIKQERCSAGGGGKSPRLSKRARRRMERLHAAFDKAAPNSPN